MKTSGKKSLAVIAHRFRKQDGSLALEQVLFIGAIVTMSVGLIAFYSHLAQYFQDFNVGKAPTINSGTTTTTNP